MVRNCTTAQNHPTAQADRALGLGVNVTVSVAIPEQWARSFQYRESAARKGVLIRGVRI
jgi:hypothetical protein